MSKLFNYFLPAFLTMASFFQINSVEAQCGPLSTPSFTNNGQSGIMFDIVGITSVNLTQFSMDYDNGIYNIEIYSIPGTHVGNETNAAAWTLLGTANGWTATTGLNVLIPITFNQLLCPGDVAGFYITANNGTGGNYSNGTGVGNIAAADANIQILEGTGKAYPFGTSFTPRVPNVTVNYSCVTGCCIPPTMSMTEESCAGACDGTATATPSVSAVPVFTYQWDAAAGNQTTQTATGLCAGTYSVDMTDGAGCVSTTTITVTTSASGADATITPVAILCETDPSMLLVGADPGGVWSGTGITNTATGDFSPATAGPGMHTITYGIAGVCGDTQTVVITIDPSVSAAITPVGPFCQVDPSVNLVGASAGGTWSGTGITDAALGTFDPTSAGAGLHTITYTIAGACSDVQTYDIQVDASYSAVITPVGPYCLDDASVTLTAVSPGGTWSGSGITDAVTGNFDPMTAGVGTHTITYAIAGTCGDIQTETITIIPLDDATITPLGPICLGSVTDMIAVTPGGTWSGTGITDPVLGTFDATTAGTGTHTITYVTVGQCSDMTTTTVQVYDALSLIALGTTAICDGSSTTLSVSGSGGDGNINFIWTDPAMNVVGTGTSISVSPTTTTTYTVTIADGCTTPTSSASVTVTVYPIPTVTFFADDNLGCTPFDVVFTNTSSPIGMDCSWDFGNGITAIGCDLVSTQYTGVGCYDVTLTVTSNGCSNSETLTDFVCVAEQPDANFSFSPLLIDVTDPIVTFSNQSTYSDYYYWDFDNGYTSDQYNPIVDFGGNAGGYNVCLTSSNSYGCADTVCHPLTVDGLLLYFIPNAFTPDGDEHNQTLQPVFTSGFDPYDFTFRIFNRWGEVIWESHDATVGWDGTYAGEKVAAGTYVWTAEFKLNDSDARKTDSGHVNLLR